MSVKIQQDRRLKRFDWFVVIRGRTVAGGQAQDRAEAMAAGRSAERRITQRKGGKR